MKPTLCLLLSLGLSLCLHAKKQSYPTAYLYSYPQTVIATAKAPVTWSNAVWLKAAGIVGIGAGLYLIDYDVQRFTLDNRNSFSADFSKAAKQFGEGKYILPAIAVTTIGGQIFQSDKTTDTGLLCLKSFLLSNSATQVLKAISQRERPEANRGKQFFNGSGYRKNRESFPSGHATVAWAIAPILAEQYKDNSLITPLVYSIATLTSISRVHDNKHWASDAFIGSVIGYLGAQMCLKTTPRLQVLPNADLQGLSFSWDW